DAHRQTGRGQAGALASRSPSDVGDGAGEKQMQYIGLFTFIKHYFRHLAEKSVGMKCRGRLLTDNTL
ncbi:MAG: hypothetical protein OEU92_20190, partial [Alphaproteobacteria bacterium]|nr:hypothetical protein [Alphaproteobacteria bacterium]